MKVDFVKEVKNDGGIMYYTNIDGFYANNSLSHDSEKAMAIYESIISGKSKSETTIIRTTIIENGN
ncbi:MAG: hypothetical protein ACRCW1_08155 [Anaerotignaceae bacterium]